MRIGTPPSSVNCLVAAGFLLLPRESETIRVPKPAAGTITTTFIAGCKYTRGRASVQIGSPNVRLLPVRYSPYPHFAQSWELSFPPAQCCADHGKLRRIVSVNYMEPRE